MSGKKSPLSSLQAFVAAWDGGRESTRLRLAAGFVEKYRDNANPLVERDFGQGGSLLLTRFSAWLRLSYVFGKHLGLKLGVLSVFLRAADGQRFLAEFLEVGGLSTVLHILSLDVGEEELQAALGILTHIARVGRAYKELLAEGGGSDEGIKAIALCLANTSSSDAQDAGVSLLRSLGEGNPKYIDSVRLAFLLLLPLPKPRVQQMAAQSLQTLLISLPPPSDVYIQPSLLMLRSTNLKVQYEALQLFKLFVHHEHLVEPVITALISLLSPSRDIMDVVMASSSAALQSRLTRGSLARNAFLTKDPTTDTVIPAAFPQQAAAARILGTYALIHHSLAGYAISQGAVQGLLRSLVNCAYYESQRHAAATLSSYSDLFPHLGAHILSLHPRIPLLLDPNATSASLESIPEQELDAILVLASNLRLVSQGDDFGVAEQVEHLAE